MVLGQIQLLYQIQARLRKARAGSAEAWQTRQQQSALIIEQIKAWLDQVHTFYTLIGNCHRSGIDATAYPDDIFNRRPMETNRTVHRLTLHAWAAEQTMMRQALAQRAFMP